MKNTIKYIKKYGWCIVCALSALCISTAITIGAIVMLVFQALAWPSKFVVTKCIELDRKFKLTEMM